jgi:hypothetical protein
VNLASILGRYVRFRVGDRVRINVLQDPSGAIDGSVVRNYRHVVDVTLDNYQGTYTYEHRHVEHLPPEEDSK